MQTPAMAQAPEMSSGVISCAIISPFLAPISFLLAAAILDLICAITKSARTLWQSYYIAPSLACALALRLEASVYILIQITK